MFKQTLCLLYIYIITIKNLWFTKLKNYSMKLYYYIIEIFQRDSNYRIFIISQSVLLA